MPSPFQPPWEIRPSPIHGCGLFARTPLPAHLRLIEYVGRKITKAQSIALCRQNNPFVFFLDNEWDLDGDTDANPARFINHSCEPNCQTERENQRIWIATLRTVRAGEELTCDYGYDLIDYRDYPCHCRSARCAGFIVAEALRPALARLDAACG